MLTQTSYEHIHIDENKVAVIAGTTMKVSELVLEHIAHGWSPDELKYQHPYLDLGQVYSALAYYYDHKEMLDIEIENRLRKTDSIQAKIVHPSLRQKLQAKGLL
jgi:uncharacterized protein (DUF433 family)